LVARLFGGCVPLDYVTDLHGAGVPDNVQIVEFFLDPGTLLNVSHRSATMSAPTTRTSCAMSPPRESMSLLNSSPNETSTGAPSTAWDQNPDVTVDCSRHLAPQRRLGRDVVVIGEVNRQMPSVRSGGCRCRDFDSLVETQRYDYDLFAPPNQRLGTGRLCDRPYGARLVRDGGTLQIGIGELGDAVSRDAAAPATEREFRGSAGAQRRSASAKAWT